MKRFNWLSVLTACLLVGLTSVSSQAAFTAGMPQQFKNNVMTLYLVTTKGLNGLCTGSSAPYTCCSGAGAGTCTPVIKMELGLQSANTSIGPSTTTASSFTDLGTAHGYTTGGDTLSSCTVASTAGSSPLAADGNCTGGLVWTATDATGITTDCGMVYENITGIPIAFYTWTSASATGNGATFTITPPTVASGTRGMWYIAELIDSVSPTETILVKGMYDDNLYEVPVYHLS